MLSVSHCLVVGQSVRVTDGCFVRRRCRTTRIQIESRNQNGWNRDVSVSLCRIVSKTRPSSRQGTGERACYRTSVRVGEGLSTLAGVQSLWLFSRFRFNRCRNLRTPRDFARGLGLSEMLPPKNRRWRNNGRRIRANKLPRMRDGRWDAGGGGSCLPRR